MNTPTTAEQVVLLDDAGHAIGAADKAGVHGPDTPLPVSYTHLTLPTKRIV